MLLLSFYNKTSPDLYSCGFFTDLPSKTDRSTATRALPVGSWLSGLMIPCKPLPKHPNLNRIPLSYFRVHWHWQGTREV